VFFRAPLHRTAISAVAIKRVEVKEVKQLMDTGIMKEYTAKDPAKYKAQPLKRKTVRGSSRFKQDAAAKHS
jgi:hypothetical protein